VKLGAGRLADRPRLRGPMIVLGYFIAVVVRPVIAVTGAAWQVIGLRVVDRLGKGSARRRATRSSPTLRPRKCGGAPSTAARHGSRGSGTGADPRLVAARVRERERAGGDWWSIVPGVLVLVLATWRCAMGEVGGG